MEKVLEAALGQVPSLVVFSAVLVMIVKLFLQAQEQARSFIQQLHDEHISARKEMRAALDDNTIALKELAEAVVTCPLKHKGH